MSVPYFEDEWLTVHLGDCREVLARMEPGSVNCVVTSPPYWGLRDYGTPGQLGLEPTPEEYVESLVGVFREVRRVLRSDGTVWLNLGDSYASAQGGQNGTIYAPREGEFLTSAEAGHGTTHRARNRNGTPVPFGLKPKDLVGIPWRVAFALQADGWYLRSDIIWSKPNPMPESVTDRPTKSHEYLFLLSKSARYYYDAEAVREASQWAEGTGWARDRKNRERLHGGTAYDYMTKRTKITGNRAALDREERPGPLTDDKRPRDSGPALVGERTEAPGGGRNLRSVWTIATQPYPGAHFATFPEALVEPCVKAGSSEKGVCPECGAPWERQTSERPYPKELANAAKAHGGIGNNLGGQRHQDWLAANPKETTGWRRSCAHLLCSDCGNITTDGTRTVGRDLRGVRDGVPEDDTPPTNAVLLQDMLESDGGEDEADDQGLRDLRKGLRPSLSPGSPDGDEDGLFGRASAGDGRGPWTDAPANGSGRSHQRDQERQPAGEPSGAVEEGARRPLEPRPGSDGDVPGLREPLPAARQCGQCGGHLRPLDPVPSVVLDCFAGSGTTGLVANRLGRRAVLIDLSADYLGQVMVRNAQTPLGLTS